MIHAGVDKVHLFAPSGAFAVRTLNGWTEQGGGKVGEARPVFVHDGEGHPIEGAGFYLNVGGINAEVEPSGLKVRFNPSKDRHPFELLTDPAEVGRIGDGIQQTLKAHGVLVNVDDMQLSRLDLAKQAQLRHPLHSYVPALAHLKGKRMTGHQYPDGYRWANTQRQAVLYDKARELAQGKVPITTAPDRLGRMELRWTKGRPLAKDMQFSAFGALRRADPEQLTAVYRMALHRDVFRTTPQAVQLVINYDTDLDIYRSLKRQHARGALWQYLAFGSVSGTVEAHGGIDALQRFLLDAGDNPRTVRHNMQQLRARLQRDAFFNARRDREAVNVHTLLDELKHTYAA